MSERNEQLARVLTIMRHLELNPQGLTTQQLFDKIKDDYNITKRTVYRDLEGLGKAGFPVYEEPDTEDSRTLRWKCDSTLRVAKSLVLSPREFVALYLARHSLAPLRDTPFFEDIELAFKKIEDLLGAKGADYLQQLSTGIQFAPGPRWGLGVDPDVIDTVRDCCDEGHVLSVKYRSQNSGDFRVRRLGPQFLYFAQGSIYLVAEDLEVGTVKVFSVPRMSEAVRLDDEYSGKPVDPNSFFENAFGVFQGGEPEKIKLVFTPAIAEFIRERRWHGSQKVVRAEDGSVELTLHVAVTVELVNWVLGFGANVRVVQPLGLKEKILDAAVNVVKMYKTRGAA